MNDGEWGEVPTVETVPKPSSPITSWSAQGAATAGLRYFDLKESRSGFWERFGAMFIDRLIFAPGNIAAFTVLLAGPTEIGACPADPMSSVAFPRRERGPHTT